MNRESTISCVACHSCEVVKTSGTDGCLDRDLEAGSRLARGNVMKRQCEEIALLFLITACWILPPPLLLAAGGEKGGAANAKITREMIERWRATTLPGAPHAWLGAFVGEWQTVMKTWWGGPSAPPVETKGEAQIVPILGGRFILERYRGEVALPDETGKIQRLPFEGMGTLGYDNFRNVYVGTWQDTMGTAISVMHGTRIPGSNELRLFGEMDEPIHHVMGQTVKYLRKILDQDTHRLEMYDLHTAEEQKVLEITYKRKKPRIAP